MAGPLPWGGTLNLAPLRKKSFLREGNGLLSQKGGLLDALICYFVTNALCHARNESASYRNERRSVVGKSRST